MRKFPALVAATVAAGIAGLAAAQSPSSSVGSQAVPPSREGLERLGLRTEWTAHVPLDTRADGLAQVQVADDGQIFVQTRAGLLVALDAATGAKQWTYRFSRPYSNVYPVAFTPKFVFAVHVANLYCLHRYSGLLEFSYELPGAASAGPAADAENVYVAIGATKVNCYRYPQPLTAAAREAVADGAAGPGVGGAGMNLRGGAKQTNPADEVGRRYGSRGMPDQSPDPTFDPPRYPASDVYGGFDTTGNRSPSISTLPRVTSPYSMHRDVTTPSVSVLPSMRQPYELKPGYLQYNQRTPSISVLPPSLARVAELSNLRPRPVEPKLLWSLTTTRPVRFQPMLTDPVLNIEVPEVWLTTDSRLIYSVAKKDRRVMVSFQPTGAPAAPAAGPVAYGESELLGFFAQDDGTLLAVELTSGDTRTANVHFRAHVGGRLDHKPVPTRFGGVYASGEHAGLSRVDIETGDVTWRTDAADHFLAVNNEHVYALGRRGELLVFDRTRVADPRSVKVDPLARLAVPGFDMPIQNDKTDRVLLGSHNGLLVSLRSASRKYAKAVRIDPPSRQAPPPKPMGDAAPAPAGL